jgi:DNA primase
MTRIPDEELKHLKETVSLQQLAEAEGLELRRVGGDLVTRCVFHPEDNEPSLHITPKNNLFHCFGCDAAGSNIDWLMKRRHLSFRHAVEVLRSLAGGAASSAELGSSSRPLPSALPRSLDDEKLLLRVVDYYHAQLPKSPSALEYLERRGLGHPEMIGRFKLGFVDRSLPFQLPRASSSPLRGRLKELGILRPSGHERFRGQITVPIFDERGAVAELYGRRVGAAQHGAADHQYLPGPHRGVWNREALAASREIILCESIFDALSLWVHGWRNVLASFGAGGLTEEMIQALVRAGVRAVIFGYDRDEAGDRAVPSQAARLAAEGIGCFRLELPWGMDVNEFVLSQQDPPAALAHALRSSRWLGSGAAPELETAAPGPLELLAAVPVERPEPAGQPEPVPEAQPRQPERPGLPSLAAGAAGAPEPVASAAAPEPGAPAAAAIALPPAESRNGRPRAPESAPAPAPPPRAPARTGEKRGGSRAVAPAAPAPAEAQGPHDPDGGAAELESRGEAYEARFGPRGWRVRFVGQLSSLEQLSVQLTCRAEGAFHVDSFNLYSARPRAAFIRAAASELGVEESVIKRDLGRILLALETLAEQKLREALEPASRAVVLTEQQTEEAMGLLKDPRLLARVLEDFESLGLAGERVNKLAGYLVTVSRKLERPLCLMIQSNSAAGKSTLMEAILSFVPEEDRVQYSAITGQALYYLGEQDLRHKVLAIAEEQGAERASYPLKLLMSEGKLSIASTGKDPHSGKHATHFYYVEGPVSVFDTSTNSETDEELANRFLITSVDEGREQTEAILAAQRRAHGIEGLWAREKREAILELHQNAQRLLAPVEVVNPFVERLTFLNDRTRMRRDQLKYLALIKASALVHQHQRAQRRSLWRGQEKLYVEASLEDVELATVLGSRLLGRSLDELSPQTRNFLTRLERMAREECSRLSLEQREYRFQQRDVRRFTGWSHFQVKAHMRRLVEMEYVIEHRARLGQGSLYELLYAGEGQDGRPFLMGLIDTAKLREEMGLPPYDGKWERLFGEWEPKSGGRVQSGDGAGAPREPGGSDEAAPDGKGVHAHFSEQGAKNASGPLASEKKSAPRPTNGSASGPYDGKWEHSSDEWERESGGRVHSGDAAGAPGGQAGSDGAAPDGKGAQARSARRRVKNASGPLASKKKKRPSRPTNAASAGAEEPAP